MHLKKIDTKEFNGSNQSSNDLFENKLNFLLKLKKLMKNLKYKAMPLRMTSHTLKMTNFDTTS